MANNDPSANFCTVCGGELYESTIVTSPNADRVTSTYAPTSGIRAFSDFGNGYLQTAAMAAANDHTAQPHRKPYDTHKTTAKAHVKENGTWICPDCGELNGQERLFCLGCGKYR